jgi:hypothetical protein
MKTFLSPMIKDLIVNLETEKLRDYLSFPAR